MARVFIDKKNMKALGEAYDKMYDLVFLRDSKFRNMNSLLNKMEKEAKKKDIVFVLGRGDKWKAKRVKEVI